MKRYLVLTALFLTITATPLAQTQTINPDPGWITADHPLYRIDLFLDDRAVKLGFADRGEVAFERASEIYAAVKANNSEAISRARTQLSSVTQAATSNQTDGLEKAMSVLQQAQSEAPEEAQDGLSTALEQLEAATKRMPRNKIPDLDVKAQPGKQL